MARTKKYESDSESDYDSDVSECLGKRNVTRRSPVHRSPVRKVGRPAGSKGKSPTRKVGRPAGSKSKKPSRKPSRSGAKSLTVSGHKRLRCPNGERFDKVKGKCVSKYSSPSPARRPASK